MQQSNIIIGTLFIAFIVFVTAKGELPTYIALLQGKKTMTQASNDTGLTSGTQQTSIGELPQSVLGAQIIVGSPSSQTDSNGFNENFTPAPSAGISVSGNAPPLVQ